MTVPLDVRQVIAAPAPGTTEIAFDFLVPADLVAGSPQMLVVLTRGETDTTLVYGNDWTVTGLGSPSGGTVTLAAPSEAGDVYRILGRIAHQRVSDYSLGQALPAEALNTDFDRQWMALQEMRRDIDTMMLSGGGGGGGPIGDALIDARITGRIANEDAARAGEDGGLLISPLGLTQHLGQWGFAGADAPEIPDADDANDATRAFRPTEENQPEPGTDTWIALNLRGDDGSAIQIAGDTDAEEDASLRFRRFADGVWGPWLELWHEGNLDPDDLGGGGEGGDGLDIPVIGRPAPESYIDASGFTAFGNLTQGAGVSGVFDGDLDKTAAESARLGSAADGFAGVELDRPRPFVAAIVYGPSDAGIADTDGAFALRIRGADTEPATPSAGTVLGGRAVASSPSDGSHAAGIRIESNGTAGLFKYWWVELDGETDWNLAQVQFVEPVLSPPAVVRRGGQKVLVTDAVPSIRGVPWKFDGQADEREHWNALIDGINAGDLQGLLVPAGTSLVSGASLKTITKAFWNLEGISAEASVIKKVGTDNANLFTIGDVDAPASRWRMRGLLLDFSELTSTPSGVAIRCNNGSRFDIGDIRIFQCDSGIQLGNSANGTTVAQSNMDRLQILMIGAGGGKGIDDHGSSNIKLSNFFITAMGGGTNHNCMGIRMKPGPQGAGDAWKVVNGEVNLTNANCGYALMMDCTNLHLGNRVFANCVFDRADLASVYLYIPSDASEHSARNLAALFTGCILDAGNSPASEAAGFLIRNNQSDGSGIYVSITGCQVTTRNGPAVQFVGTGPIHAAITGTEFFERGQNPAAAVINDANASVRGAIVGNRVRGGINFSGSTVQPQYFINGGSAVGLHVRDNLVDECSGGLYDPTTQVREWTRPKASDETATNDATLNNDSELRVRVAPSSTYRFRVHAFYSSPGAAGFKWGITGPATPVAFNASYQAIPPGDGAPATGTLTAYETAGIEMTHTTGEAGGQVIIEGVIKTDGGGTMIFTWCQQASDAGETTVLAGSYIEVELIA